MSAVAAAGAVSVDESVKDVAGSPVGAVSVPAGEVRVRRQRVRVPMRLVWEPSYQDVALSVYVKVKALAARPEGCQARTQTIASYLGLSGSSVERGMTQLLRPGADGVVELGSRRRTQPGGTGQSAVRTVRSMSRTEAFVWLPVAAAEDLTPRQLRVFALVAYAQARGIALTEAEIASCLLHHSGEKVGRAVSVTAASAVVDEVEAARWMTVQRRAGAQGRNLYIAHDLAPEARPDVPARPTGDVPEASEAAVDSGSEGSGSSLVGEGSGSPVGEGSLANRESPRTDSPEDGRALCSSAVGEVQVGKAAGPLRGEKPIKSPVVEQQTGGDAAGAGARLTVVGGRKTRQQGRPELPADLGLRVALAPVSWLWRGLSRWQQDQVVHAAQLELARLRHVLEWSGQAPSVLAARLTARLEVTGGEARIARPFGWITHRGLVRRPSCSDVRCDDGARLDTGAECENCANVLHSRRAWRVRIAAEVDRELPGLEADARYREIEARMRRHAAAEAADFVDRQAKAREWEARRAAYRAEAEARALADRERAAAEAAARQVLGCADCGRARSAGLCEVCGHRRQTEALIGEAALLAATWSADLTDPSGVAAVAAEVRRAIEDAIAAEWAQFQQITRPDALEATGPDAVKDAAAHNAFLTAESAAVEYRQQALMMLGRSEDAQAEARRAFATELAKPWYRAVPGSDDAQRAAAEAAAQARTRTAEYLLAVRLEQLRTRARPEPVRPASWAQRLPGLAARSLGEEVLR